MMKIIILILLFAALCVSGCTPSYYQAQNVLKAYPGADIKPSGSDSFYVRTPDNRVFKVSAVADKPVEVDSIFPAR